MFCQSALWDRSRAEYSGFVLIYDSVHHHDIMTMDYANAYFDDQLWKTAYSNPFVKKNCGETSWEKKL